jgi:hypothetical protein
MTTKHTPLPWIWNEGRPANYDLEWLRGPNGERILDIYGNGKMTPDKLLLAAAPDLLAVCEAILEYWESDPSGFAECEPGCNCIVDQLRAALDKAVSAIRAMPND